MLPLGHSGAEQVANEGRHSGHEGGGLVDVSSGDFGAERANSLRIVFAIAAPLADIGMEQDDLQLVRVTSSETRPLQVGPVQRTYHRRHAVSLGRSNPLTSEQSDGHPAASPKLAASRRSCSGPQ